MNVSNTTEVAPPEIELVVLSASEGTPARRARMQELVHSRLNWERVIQSAAAHSVTPLLYHALSREMLDGTPAEVEARLRADCQRIAIANLIAAGELARIGRAFAAHDIRMLAFKGPTLATLAYGDLALREFSDLDILIDAADFQRASPLLISMGYRIGYDLTPDQHQYHVARHGEALYSGDKIDVDLHIRLLGERFRLELTFGELWERRQPVTVAGGTAGCTISNEDLCVYLAVHGAKHCWQRLSWIRDMSYLLQPGVILDWPAALSRARSLGCERIVLLGLALAQQVLASALPEAVAERCREDAVVAKLTQSVVLGLFNPERMMGAFGRIGFAYRCRGRLGEALYWVAAMTFLPHVSDWRSLHLPRALWFLYPLIRPLRLAAKYLSRTGRN